MGRCTYRTLGRRYGCEKDLAAEVDALSQFVGGFGGNTYFVDPNGGSNAYGGLNPSTPLRTVAAAVAKCRAYRNDAIIVAPNSYWQYGDVTVGRANPVSEAVTIGVPGIRLIGVTPDNPLGVPWVPPAASATCITVTAMDVTIEGFNFWLDSPLASTSGIAAAWDSPDLFGENLHVRDCYFEALAEGIVLDYTYNCIIENCRFDSLTSHALHNTSVFGDPDFGKVRECEFLGNTADINLPDCEFWIIEGNTFMNVTAAIVMTGGANNQILTNSIQGSGAGANNYINLTGGTNNLVGSNLLACTIAQYDTTCSDATSGYWIANQCTNGATAAPPT